MSKEKELKDKLQNGLESLEDDTSKMNFAVGKLERASRLKQERAEYYKLRGETFSTARTYEETEGDLPSIESLATSFITKSEGDYTTKTRKEILEGGSMLEKMRLFYSSADISNYFEGMDKTLTQEEMAKVKSSIRTIEDAALAKKCTTEYYTISEFGRTLSYYYKRYQAVFGKLAVLLNRWDEYDRVVDTYNRIQASILEADYTDKPRPELQREHDLNSLGAKVLQLTKLPGAKIKRGEGTDISFYLHVDGKGGLYPQIKRAAKEAKEALCDFKAYAMVAEEYIEKSTLKLTPISILMSTENAECQRYEMFLVENPIYFDYIREGEPLSPDEEKRAVIPDYYKVKPSKNIYRDCKQGIKTIENENL